MHKISLYGKARRVKARRLLVDNDQISSLTAKRRWLLDLLLSGVLDTERFRQEEARLMREAKDAEAGIAAAAADASTP